jgi:hypothetical protein
MKILIAANWEGSWPYLPEMVEEFQRLGAQADVFDINEIGPVPLAAKIAFRAPRLRQPTIAALLKRRLAAFPGGYDGVNIHFAAPIYRRLARPLKARGKRLVTSIWGSDFLRASPQSLEDLSYIFTASDVVTTNNPEIRRRLLLRFPEIDNKIRVLSFGMRSLDVIRELKKTETQEDSRRRLGLPSDKLIVTVGYNGMPQQQHGMIIDGLDALSAEAKVRLFVLVPMTYPDNPGYQAEVEARMQAAGVDFAMLRDKLDIKDICRIRIVSDYAINMQTTDSLSASIQEHIFAGSTVIVGRWLPYDIFEEMGVPLRKVDDARGIAAALETPGRDRNWPPPPAYAEKIYERSSWSSSIGKWMDLYRP